ncbi:hypothetical protein GCM10022281_14480 [Sphingomonas rosea]|uniref:UrcA family protein n=1 Tax=Sphingomonas rosea TaxID=335605 RepID=A0ABP7U3A9_9SPHN
MKHRLQSTGLAALAFSVSLGLVGVTVAQPASAQSQPIKVTAPEEEIVTRRVPVGDLDLSKPAAFRTLHHRIRAAAHQICVSYETGGQTADEAQCNWAAIRSTDTQVAALRARASQLAEAGLPGRIDVALAMTGPDAE